VKLQGGCLRLSPAFQSARLHRIGVLEITETCWRRCKQYSGLSSPSFFLSLPGNGVYNSCVMILRGLALESIQL
jgi:hypothetical protein